MPAASEHAVLALNALIDELDTLRSHQARIAQLETDDQPARRRRAQRRAVTTRRRGPARPLRGRDPGSRRRVHRGARSRSPPGQPPTRRSSDFSPTTCCRGPLPDPVRVVGAGARRSRRLAGHPSRRRGALPHRLRHRGGLPLADGRALSHRRRRGHAAPRGGRRRSVSRLVPRRPRREPLSRVRRLIGGAAVPGNLAAARDRWRSDARQADRRLRRSGGPRPGGSRDHASRPGLPSGVRDAARSRRRVPDSAGRVRARDPRVLP